MSTMIRKLVFGIIGLLGGLAAWPIAELFLTFQSRFPSFLVFSIYLGAVFGAVMGAFLGSGEGITLSIRPKIVPGMLTGALVGIIGGAVGFLIGQGVLLFVSEIAFHSNKALRAIGLPISRVVSWTLLGMFIGMVEGIRALSWAKIRVGILGGFVGGILGGSTMEALTMALPVKMVARVAGLLVFGFLIGFFYGLFEKGLSNGVLKLLNGKLKGKEYLLVQRKIRIGSSPKADIRLVGYEGVADFHAQIAVRKDAPRISSISDKHHILINELVTDDYQLRFEDVLQIGSANFLFYYK